MLLSQVKLSSLSSSTFSLSVKAKTCITKMYWAAVPQLHTQQANAHRRTPTPTT